MIRLRTPVVIKKTRICVVRWLYICSLLRRPADMIARPRMKRRLTNIDPSNEANTILRWPSRSMKLKSVSTYYTHQSGMFTSYEMLVKPTALMSYSQDNQLNKIPKGDVEQGAYADADIVSDAFCCVR